MHSSTLGASIVGDKFSSFLQQNTACLRSVCSSSNVHLLWQIFRNNIPNGRGIKNVFAFVGLSSAVVPRAKYMGVRFDQRSFNIVVSQ